MADEYRTGQINFTHIEYFVAIVQAGSFRKAAKELYITQPTLSYSINVLEKSLGVRLLEREYQKIKLTPAGDALFAEALEILKHMESIHVMMECFRVDYHSREQLRICSMGFLLNYCFNMIISPFSIKYPNANIILEQDFIQKMNRKLLRNEVDAIITRNDAVPDLSSDFESLPIMKDEFVLIVPEKHPFSYLDVISSMAEFENDAFVTLDTEIPSDLFIRTMSICIPLGYKPKIVKRVSTFETIHTVVAAGTGISIVQYLNGHFGKTLPIKYIRLSGDFLDSDIVLYWSKENDNPILHEYIDFVRTLLSSEDF